MKSSFSIRIGKFALFSATFIWGSTFLLMKDMLNTFGTYHLLAIRFSVAALILGYLFHHQLRTLTPPLFWRGFLLGLFLFLAYAAQTEGLKTISAGKSAFLSSVYCVFVPLLSWIFLQKKPTLRQSSAAIICLVGIACISLDTGLSIAYGEIITLCGGIFFSLHVMALSHHDRKLPILALTVLQFITSAILAWGFAFFLEEPNTQLFPAASASLFYLCVFGTALAFLLQNFSQQKLSASTAALILSFESVFGATFSFLFANEPLTPPILLGFSLIFGAVLLNELSLERPRN